MAKQYGMTHYNGIELSCCFVPYEVGLDYSWVCHVLGYCFDLDRMKEKLAEIEEEKEFRLRDLIETLIKNGYKIELKNIEKNGKITNRTSIAKELIAKDYAKDADECFEKILNTESYLKFAKDKPSLSDGIRIIQDCGGVAILAHPFFVTHGGKKELSREQIEKFLHNARSYGIDGVEVYYHEFFDTQKIKFLEEYANQTKQIGGGEFLYKSIGSDYHMTAASERWLNEHPEYKLVRAQERIFCEFDSVEIDEGIVEKLTTASKKQLPPKKERGYYIELADKYEGVWRVSLSNYEGSDLWIASGLSMHCRPWQVIVENGWTEYKREYQLWGKDAQKFFKHIGIYGLTKIKAEKVLRTVFLDKEKIVERFLALCAECGIEPHYEAERIKRPDGEE